MHKHHDDLIDVVLFLSVSFGGCYPGTLMNNYSLVSQNYRVSIRLFSALQQIINDLISNQNPDKKKKESGS